MVADHIRIRGRTNLPYQSGSIPDSTAPRCESCFSFPCLRPCRTSARRRPVFHACQAPLRRPTNDTPPRPATNLSTIPCSITVAPEELHAARPAAPPRAVSPYSPSLSHFHADTFSGVPCLCTFHPLKIIVVRRPPPCSNFQSTPNRFCRASSRRQRDARGCQSIPAPMVCCHSRHPRVAPLCIHGFLPRPISQFPILHANGVRVQNGPLQISAFSTQPYSGSLNYSTCAGRRRFLPHAPSSDTLSPTMRVIAPVQMKIEFAFFHL